MPDLNDPEFEEVNGDESSLEEDALEPFREVPVGTNDPNIVGDVGAFDKPPGQDPEDEGN